MSEPYRPPTPFSEILPIEEFVIRLATLHGELRGFLGRLEGIALAAEARGLTTPEDVLDMLCLLHYVGRKLDALTLREELVLLAALEAEGEVELAAELRAERSTLRARRAALVDLANLALEDPKQTAAVLATSHAFVTRVRAHLTREEQSLASWFRRGTGVTSP